MDNGIGNPALAAATGADELRSVTVRVAELGVELVALDRLLNSRIVAEADKVALALTASDRAITKAEAANEKRFESVNEFRQTLSDQTKTLMPRTEIEQLSRTLTEKIDATNKALSELRSRIDIGNPDIGHIQKELATNAGVLRGGELTVSKIVTTIGISITILGFVLSIVIMLANRVI